MSHENNIYLFHYNGETKEECVQNLNICLLCCYMKLSMTNSNSEYFETLIGRRT